MVHRLLFTRLTIIVTCAILAVPVATADTLAWWRHEEGVAGGFVDPNDPNAVIDSSGSGNHMRTFDINTAAIYTTDVSPVPLRSGAPNLLALDFTLDTDLGGPDWNDDNYTDLKFIELEDFGELTLEFAFKPQTNFIFQAIVGKDGQPLAENPIPPLVAKVRGDGFPGGVFNQLQIEWLDGDGDQHGLFSGIPMIPGTWYHVAFVLRDTTSELWIASGAGEYVQVAGHTDEDFAGTAGEVIYSWIAPFSVGRGQFGGGNADWAEAIIDEVRVSNTALSPSEFLFDPSQLGDDDGDGVLNGADLCPNTPPDTSVDEDGRPVGDLNEDCRNDMTDFSLYQLGFTGP